jgi:superfamily II DNA or RNA helicase
MEKEDLKKLKEFNQQYKRRRRTLNLRLTRAKLIRLSNMLPNYMVIDQKTNTMVLDEDSIDIPKRDPPIIAPRPTVDPEQDEKEENDQDNGEEEEVDEEDFDEEDFGEQDIDEEDIDEEEQEDDAEEEELEYEEDQAADYATSSQEERREELPTEEEHIAGNFDCRVR